MSTSKWDRESLRRCEACGGKLVRIEPVEGGAWHTLYDHMGHRLHSIRRVTLYEFVKIWLGFL